MRVDRDRKNGSLLIPATFKISPIPSLIKRGIFPIWQRDYVVFHSWFENLTTNGIRHVKNQLAVRPERVEGRMANYDTVSKGEEGGFCKLIIAVTSITPEQMLLHFLNGGNHAPPAGHFPLLFILNDERGRGEDTVKRGFCQTINSIQIVVEDR